MLRRAFRAGIHGRTGARSRSSSASAWSCPVRQFGVRHYCGRGVRERTGGDGGPQEPGRLVLVVAPVPRQIEPAERRVEYGEAALTHCRRRCHARPGSSRRKSIALPNPARPNARRAPLLTSSSAFGEDDYVWGINVGVAATADLRELHQERETSSDS